MCIVDAAFFLSSFSNILCGGNNNNDNNNINSNNLRCFIDCIWCWISYTLHFAFLLSVLFFFLFRLLSSLVLMCRMVDIHTRIHTVFRTNIFFLLSLVRFVLRFWRIFLLVVIRKYVTRRRRHIPEIRKHLKPKTKHTNIRRAKKVKRSRFLLKVTTKLMLISTFHWTTYAMSFIHVIFVCDLITHHRRCHRCSFIISIRNSTTNFFPSLLYACLRISKPNGDWIRFNLPNWNRI